MSIKSKIFWSFFLLLMVAIIPQLASAQSNIDGDFNNFVKPFLDGEKDNKQIITVKANEIIEDNFVRFASQVKIEGDVHGDVIVGAGELIINGDVSGDVIAAATKIEINGRVQGNVRVAANQVTLNNTVGKNVNILAGQAELTDNALVSWSLAFWASKISIKSPIGGNIYGYGGQVIINNTVGSSVTLIFDDRGQVTLDEGAIISGNFNYRGEKNAIIKNNAKIQGNTVHKLVPANILKDEKFLSYAWVYSKIISLFSILLIGVILISLFDKKTRLIANEIWPKPLPKILWGILLLIGTPIAALIIALTIIGIPLAIIIAGSYFLLLYLSQIFIGLMIGQKIIKTKTEDKRKFSLIWAMMLGTFIYFILINLPNIGGLISLIGTIWFLGTTWQIIIPKKQINKEQKNDKAKQKNI